MTAAIDRIRAGEVSRDRVAMALALVVLNVADVIVTKAVLDNGGVEGNPLMVGLMAGFTAPLALKAAVAGLAGFLLIASPPSSRLADRAAATVVGIYIAIVMWNCALLGWLALQP